MRGAMDWINAKRLAGFPAKKRFYIRDGKESRK